MENNPISNINCEYSSNNQEPNIHSVPYLQIDRGYIVFKGQNYIEVEDVLITPQDNPPL